MMMQGAAVNEMMIKIAEKTEIEHLISILNLGVCVAIENGVLSIEEAAILPI